MPNKPLTVGMVGEDVAALQQALVALGLSIPEAEARRRFFGPGTREAVQQCQAQSGLTPNGICDESLGALLNLPAVGGPPPVPPAHAASPGPFSVGVQATAPTTRRPPIDVIVQPSPTPRPRIDVVVPTPARPPTTAPQPGGSRLLVYGRVHRPDGTPVVGVTVRALHQADQNPVDLGHAITNNDGGYRIVYGNPPGANLLMQVADPDGKLLAHPPVLHNAGPEQRIDILATPLEASEPHCVKGVVQSPDGTPLSGLIVKAFDKDLRHEQELGIATSGPHGYQIPYTAAQFRRAEKAYADLIVRAYVVDPNAMVPVYSLVASSPSIFNAQPIETVDLTVGGELRGLSEYERYLKDLTPLAQDIALADLREDEEEDREKGKFQDVTFLAGETAIDPEHIAFLIQAHRLQRKTDLAPEIFYGLFREGMPTELSALLAQSPEVQRRALVKAVEDNIIPQSFGAEVGTILERLKQLIASLALEEPRGRDRTTLAQLIGTVLPEREHQAAFLSAYVNHSGPIAEFWQGLEARPGFKDRVADLQLTLQLGALARNHLPLVRELQRMKQAGDIHGLSDLTRLDENDWHEIITRPREGDPIGVPPDVPGKDTEEKVRNYARAMAHMVEDAFPTAFATHRLEKDHLPGRANLHTFFKANPGFNPRTTRLDSYLKDHPEAFEGVAETDREETKINLKAMTRLYRLAPRYSQVSTLLKDGLDSAHGIAGMGRNVFLARHGEALGGKATGQDGLREGTPGSGYRHDPVHGPRAGGGSCTDARRAGRGGARSGRGAGVVHPLRLDRPLRLRALPFGLQPSGLPGRRAPLSQGPPDRRYGHA